MQGKGALGRVGSLVLVCFVCAQGCSQAVLKLVFLSWLGALGLSVSLCGKRA